MSALRPCPSCGRPRRGDACVGCGWTRAKRGRKRPGVRPDLNTAAWKRRSLEARQAHVAAHGLVCPGWQPTGHAPHPVRAISELTGHHLTRDPDGPITVLCRSENASLGRPS